MAHHRYFIQLAYQGTHYFGWQIQSNHNSVQAEIERALTQLNSNQKIEITGCGRTDTGVHASDYCAHFDLEREIDPQHWKYKLNQMLPNDIAIKNVFVVAPTLHARFDAVSRTYEYRIHTSKDPFVFNSCWVNNLKLDLEKIQQACELMKLHTDFECFSKVHTDVTNFNCQIHKMEWQQTENGYLFRISANRFLRNMVRAVVGTLIEVGTGKISVLEFEEILHSKNRSKAGTSVPANGLTLVKIDYPDGSF
ncbi:MAG: tRNA pseudouridine(38-40) synthase TruA [Crocinitomicaceae bacterium]|nr:tRNA pseudouridine(38-40) synthase TruA [Crocinitomicaceae bacterium]